MLLDYILQRVNARNTNFMGIIVGEVGTGKSWSSIAIAERLDPSFNVDRVYFDIKSLLKDLKSNKIKATQAVILDEAGVNASNRDSYMSDTNKVISFLNQTWRLKRIICFWTVPNISFIDKGTRGSFNMIFETKRILKSKNRVVISGKNIQVNQQSGKVYMKNWYDGANIIQYKCPKPSLKLRRDYETKKEMFFNNLVNKLEKKLNPQQELKDKFRCPICKSKNFKYRQRQDGFYCRRCGNTWKKDEKWLKQVGLK